MHLNPMPIHAACILTLGVATALGGCQPRAGQARSGGEPGPATRAGASPAQTTAPAPRQTTSGATTTSPAPASGARAPFPVALVSDTSRPGLLGKVRLPAGFTIQHYAKDVPHARSLARGAKGTIFVGNRNGGSVYALVDADGDQVAEKRYTIASGLRMPNGVAFRDGALYVAEVSRILRFDNIEANLQKPPRPVVVSEAFPSDVHHGWKFIRFGPDGKLYVPVGAPCNICLRADNKKYASITRMKPDGTGQEIVAHGVRNTVGFDWHPVTKELWFTDNGRDHLGDDKPPCELNRARKDGQHFGYPFCHGASIADPKFGGQRKCADLTPPAQELGPHVAPLGMRFYTGSMFPAQYKHQVFIAEHGSWNRSKPIGYRVTLVQLDAKGKALQYSPFATGWLNADGSRWGRPVDVLNMPDGALLVSDDYAGAVYRITYKKP